MAVARAMRSVGEAVLGSVSGQRRSPKTIWKQGVGWGASTLNGGFERAQYFGMLWHFYRNTAYINDPQSDPFDVISRYLSEQRLYPLIKGIYNPVPRLVNAIVAVTVGGKLDPQAGNGTVRHTALPVITENEDIREPIAKFWAASGWDRKKSLLPRLGAATGAVGLRIIDEPDKGRVRQAIVPPWEVAAVELDDSDNVIFWRQEYWYDEVELVEKRGALFQQTQLHRFTLEIDRDEFRTYRDREPYGFEENGGRAYWPNPYGFVPCIWVKHIDAGPDTDVGLCAYHNSIPLINTMNETASHLAEQIKKSVHPQWFISGATEPRAGRFLAGLRVWWSPNSEAKAQVLNDRLDIGGVVEDLKSQLAELERNHPLLNFYIVRNRVGGSGDLSGKAVHTMLYDIEADADEQRAPYDAAQVRAQKMALSIGGFRRYEGYEAFAQDDIDAAYGEGALDHFIGDRPLIRVDEEQELALAQKTAEVTGLFIKAEKESGLRTDEIIQALQAAQAQVQSGYIENGETDEINFLSEDQKAFMEAEKDLALNPPPPVVPSSGPPAGGAKKPQVGKKVARKPVAKPRQPAPR